MPFSTNVVLRMIGELTVGALPGFGLKDSFGSNGGEYMFLILILMMRIGRAMRWASPFPDHRSDS